MLEDHPLRDMLHGEDHARPFVPLYPPERVSHIAMDSGEAGEAADRAHLAKLCERFGVAAPANSNYFYHDFGPFRLKWERHTEFCTYTFLHREPFTAPFDAPVVDRVPADWLARLPGRRLVAIHMAVERADAPLRDPTDLARLIGSETVVGSIMSGGGYAWTDFHVHGDGFSRILVRDSGLSPYQVGRLVQRLLEIETYRIFALLSLPLARTAAAEISKIDHDLADVTDNLSEMHDIADEREMLIRITSLAARIERIASTTTYRFGASLAYYALVMGRIEELREERIEGLQTIGEFMERRLAPAMRTCESVASAARTCHSA